MSQQKNQAAPTHFGMVRGHALIYGGGAFDKNGKSVPAGEPFTPTVGYAMCECRQMSPEPLSGNEARRRWHRQHKAAVRDARDNDRR